MKTLKDVIRAAELVEVRESLVTRAQKFFAQSCETSGWLTVGREECDAAFGDFVEIKECRDRFKALLQDELEAQRNKIDQELIAMGIDPHADGDAPHRHGDVAAKVSARPGETGST
jgi:hypothetical protein